MNLIACNGEWLADGGGYLRCSGVLQAVTSDQVNAGNSAGITSAEVDSLLGATLAVFALVFVIRVAAKALK